MSAKILAEALSIFIIFILIILIISFFMHQNVEGEINYINYLNAETVSNTGIFTSKLYQELEDEVNRYGDFRIKIRYDSLLPNGRYDTFYGINSVADVELKRGDRVIVFIEAKRGDLFEKLINFGLFYSDNKNVKYRIKSVKTAIVSNTVN
jgi:hypothetical protein